MAHSLSAKKRIRQNEKNRARNRARKQLLKDTRKNFTIALASGDVKKTAAALQVAVQRLDKVAAKNTIHKKTASRTRSRLTLKLNALRAGKGTAAATA